MAVYCRQKELLLRNNIFIHAKSPMTGRFREDQLKVWLEVEDYDEATGEVATRAGIWQRDDLDFINTSKEQHADNKS